MIRNSIVTFSMERGNSKAVSMMDLNGVLVPVKNVKKYLDNQYKLSKQFNQLSIMTKVAKKGVSTKGSSAKAKPAKVAKVAKVKKEKVVRVITREDFPEKGFGFDEKAMTALFHVAKEKGYRNMTQVVRAACEKAFGIKNQE